MQIKILKPGILSTVQDLGRYSYRSQAVAVSGAMDTLSHRLANKVLGNPDGAPTIEFSYAAAEFICETDVLIAYSGAGAFLVHNGIQLISDSPVFLSKGSKVKLIHNPDGARTYLAIVGGWDVPGVMGSCSTYLTAKLGGINGGALIAAQLINANPLITNITTAIIRKFANLENAEKPLRIHRQSFLSAKRKTIRIFMAREHDWFEDSSIFSLLNEPFKIGRQSNRMGYQLEGNAMKRITQQELLSTAVTQGTIQVNGAGQLILLMADCQTTGGYPRIAQVAAIDLPLCAQLKPGDVINFKNISHDEAEKLYIAREKELKKLDAAIASRLSY